MRKVTNEEERKSLARMLLLGLEGACRDFDASVKAFLDSGDLSHAEKVLAFSEEIRRTLTTIEVLLGLRPGEVEITPQGGLLVKVFKGQIAQNQNQDEEACHGQKAQ